VHRLHAPFVTEKESPPWSSSGGPRDGRIRRNPASAQRRTCFGEPGAAGEDGDEENDPLYNDAVRLVVEFAKASTSLLQRAIRIGYGAPAHLIDRMERDGIVGRADGPSAAKCSSDRSGFRSRRVDALSPQRVATTESGKACREPREREQVRLHSCLSRL